MAWNDQGGNGKDPWGQGGKEPDGPPDLDELFRRLKRKFSDMSGSRTGGSGQSNKGGTKAGFFGFGFIFIILVLMWVISGIYIVRPAERAVVLRFGQYVDTQGPGPHWVPRFIDSYRIVNVEQRFTEKYGSEMLTKDENIIGVEMSVFYRVADARQYLYNVKNPIQSLQEVMRSALRQEVGNSTLDQVLTTGRDAIRENTFKNIEAILARYETGLDVVEVNLEAVRPPSQVIDAFDDVQRATEDGVTYVKRANEVANKLVAESKGKIDQILAKAKADRQEIVANASAGIAGYNKVLSVYEQPGLKAVTRKRMYIESIESILEHTKKVMMDTSGSGNVTVLPLGQLLSLQKAQASTEANHSNEPPAQSSRPETYSIINRSGRDFSLGRGN